MIKRITLLLPILALIASASCKQSKTAEQLYGKWKYVKIDHPAVGDTATRLELEQNNPSIEFTRDDQLIINWGGEVLSHGKFKLDGDNIRYTEDLGSGKTREFPFYVSSLTDKEIIFETTGKDASRVKAIKER